MGNSSNSKNSEITNSEQANTIARLEDEIKKNTDPNAGPRIIKKGNQLHPKYQRNKNKIPATIPKE